MSKKISRILTTLLVLMSMCISTCQPVLANDNDSSVTMGELEDEMIAYVNENYPDIEYGGQEYFDFIIEQLMGDTDEELKERDDYEDLILYANQYVYELDNAQTLVNEDGIFEFPQSERELTPREIRMRADESEAEDNEKYEASKSKTLLTRSSNYDSDDAAAYAIKWAKGRNANYNNYRNDCTNFVSQALVAGGIDMDFPRKIPAGIKDTTSYWYSRIRTYEGSVPFYDESSSFISVEDLYEYLTGESLVTVTSTSSLDDVQEDAEIGDIIQLKRSGGDYYHSIIITSGESGDLEYCGHTRNRKNWDLSTLADDDTISRFRIIHFE